MSVSQQKIEVFQDLSIASSVVDAQRLRNKLVSLVKPPWFHEPRSEDCKGVASPAADYIAFRRDAVGKDPTILVLLHRLNDDVQYDLVNIVPTAIQSLGICGYNDALKDFQEQLIDAENAEIPIDVRTTERYQSVTDWMSPEAVDALQSFSTAANRYTVESHPADAARWRKFVIADFHSPRRMNTSLFGRWLIEVERWPDDEAQELSTDREKGLDLLDDFVTSS